MLGLLAVQMDRERQEFRRCEPVEMFFEQQRVRTEIDVFFALDQLNDDLINLLVDQRFATGDRNHRGTAFFCGTDRVFNRNSFVQDSARVIDLAAAGTGEITTE